MLLQEQIYKTLIFYLSETCLIGVGIKNIEGISFLLVSSEEVEEIIIFKPVSLKNNMPNFLTNSKGSRKQFHTKRKQIVNENYIQRFPNIRSFATKLNLQSTSIFLSFKPSWNICSMFV